MATVCSRTTRVGPCSFIHACQYRLTQRAADWWWAPLHKLGQTNALFRFVSFSSHQQVTRAVRHTIRKSWEKSWSLNFELSELI
jgi:hypothetical protein